MGEGFSGVGTALQEGVDNYVQSETDQFITDLMAAGSQEERDAMIGEANNAFLNIDTINKTNYELGEPDREMDMFNKQLVAKDIIDKQNNKLLAENRIKVAEITAGAKKPKVDKNFGADPTGADGYFATAYPKNDDIRGWWSGGYDVAADKDFVEQRGNFISSKYATSLKDSDGLPVSNIHKYVNELANRNIITFEDRNSAHFGLGTGDVFVFHTADGEKHDLDGSEKSQSMLAEVIENTFFKGSDGGMKLSKRQIDKFDYWKVFNTNNPELVEAKGQAGAKDYFTQVYNKNIKFNSNKLSTDEISKMFGPVSEKFQLNEKEGESIKVTPESLGLNKDDFYLSGNGLWYYKSGLMKNKPLDKRHQHQLSREQKAYVDGK